MQKVINIFLILAVIALIVIVFMQYRAISKLAALMQPATPGTTRNAPEGDWIDQLSRSAKNLNIEVKY